MINKKENVKIEKPKVQEQAEEIGISESKEKVESEESPKKDTLQEVLENFQQRITYLESYIFRTH